VLVSVILNATVSTAFDVSAVRGPHIRDLYMVIYRIPTPRYWRFKRESLTYSET
jgi:hypothetical protein